MKTYLVHLTDMVPHYCTCKVEVEANSKDEAENKAKEMAVLDEVDWSDLKADFDSAEIVNVDVKELT